MGVLVIGTRESGVPPQDKALINNLVNMKGYGDRYSFFKSCNIPA